MRSVESLGWAVVTGSSSGIGAATARRLAAAGWDVVVHCRRSTEAAEAVAEQVRDLGRRWGVVEADFGVAEQCGRVVGECWDVADGRIDAWVHSAGVDLLTGANKDLPFDEKLRLATEIDLWGTIRTCRAVGERMRQRGGGRIVTVGWDQANTGMEGDSGQLFAAVKGGVMAFTRSLAKSLAPQVTVNCVSPGWIRTAWGETAGGAWQQRATGEALLERWGTPEDVAAAVEYLVAPAAAFVTGQTLHVNGGVVTS